MSKRNNTMSVNNKKMLSKEEQEIADTFQMKSGIEHVLLVPDTYIGSIAKTSKDLFIYDDCTNKIIEKNIEYIPGLYKLFDEVLVNARDHIIRMDRLIKSGDQSAKPVKNIHINVDLDGTITVMNDGNGIPIVKHPEHEIWIPELIFANLRSGANFKDKGNASLNENDDIIGGKNGYGVKLAFIWSTNGYIETIDSIRGLSYRQEINNNMYDIMPPIIQKVNKSSKSYTKVSFRPDFVRFGIPEGLSFDVRALFKKRAYDIAAISDNSVKVYYNNELIPIKGFQQYVDYYIGDKSESIRHYEESNERWEYAITLSSNGEFQHVSFVNGINTNKGGTHVNYVLDNIVSKLRTLILQKKKIDVKATTIKEQLMLFLRCDIVRPSFDSQSKEYMNTNSKDFGSKCIISDKFIEKISKIGIIETACAITDAKEKKQIAKNTDGVKKRTITGIKKLHDAEYAGTSKSASTVLILCEGESAKSAILSGLTALTDEECKRFGVYSLKGKLINVRDETVQKIAANSEICDLKEIIGLRMNEVYTLENINQLRYGKIVLLCDSDVDGSHIKGLCINFFNSQWPSLCKIEGFLSFMNTPILKANHRNTTILFYNLGQFNVWKSENDIASWNIKYYKGLGTSSKKEWMEYFQNKKFVDYIYNGALTEDKIDMVFNKKRSDERKNWLSNYNSQLYLDTNNSKVTYDDFIQQELIHFSNYDNMRSIPNIMDGLKPSLRKILYSCFKRNLTEEIKVAQLSGYVSEHSEYHHGEKSLNEAIIGLAQNFVGSNNINLLYPSGSFGTRVLGGKDHASERYIHTKLEKITRLIFPKLDDPILHYLDEDGRPIEPIYYVPILPMILVNGSSGIGTGYSTDIPSFNPKDIISYLRHKLTQSKNSNSNSDSSIYDDNHFIFNPYYEEFKGIIKKINDSQYLVKGNYQKINENTIVVTELPIGVWTQSFKEHIEDLIDNSDASLVGLTTTVKKKSSIKEDNKKSTSKDNNTKREPIIIDFKCKPSDVDIYFTITFNKDILQKLEEQIINDDCNGVHRLLKLYTTISTTNMYMYDSNQCLKKYANIKDIINEFYDTRLMYYNKRKEYRLNQLEHELVLISNKVRFILENIKGTIELKNKTIDEINKCLENKKYAKINDSYEYLTNMKIISLCKEKVDELLKEETSKNAELNHLKNTQNTEIWLNELDLFEKEYELYLINRIDSKKALTKSDDIATSTKKITNPIVKKSKK